MKAVKSGRKSRYPRPEKRFFDSLIPEPMSGCWIWERAVNSIGYGRIYVNGNHKLAHRYSYELHFGEIPNDLDVLHRCDVKCCVNPDHLFLGTHQDNMDDMIKKGRDIKHRGSQLYQAKLTEDIVMNARLMKMSSRDFSRLYRIDRRTASRALNGTTWRHV